jgi:beta-xylosidase
MTSRLFIILLLCGASWSSANSNDLAGLAKLKPLFDYWMRDTYITYVEADDTYYMTGTTSDPNRDFPGDPHARDFNDGIYLFKSKDLRDWQPLGLVWSFEKDATWHNEFVLSAPSERNLADFSGMQDKRRSVWAPEIHFVNNNFYIIACMNWHPSNDDEENGRVFLLESISGEPEGPYRDPVGRPLGNRIDPSLFEDDDGSIYFVWQDNRIARLKPDMSGFAEDPRRLLEETFTDSPDAQGIYITKKDGLYYLLQAIWWKRSQDGDEGYFRDGTPLYYDCLVSTSENIYGPYGEKYTAIRGAGHCNLFQDRDGNWWATYFGNPVGAMRPSFMARPAIIPLKFDAENKFSADWDKISE